MWLNEKHVQEGLGHQNLRKITTKYYSEHRKHRHELDNKLKQLAIKIIMDCRTTSAHKSRARLGFKQYYVILTKEKSMLTKIMSSLEGENI